MKPATPGMLLRVLRLVSNSAPQLPLYYYHYPALYTVDFPIAPLLRQAVSSGDIPALTGVKFIDSNTQDLGNATEVADGRFALLSTMSPITGTSLGCGVAGGIV